MTELLLVGVGQMGRPYLEAALRIGCTVRAVESRAAFPGLPVGTGADFYQVDNGLDESWLLGALQAAEQGPPQGVVAFAEAHVTAAALLQDRLGVPGPSLHAATISRNKGLQRMSCAARGVSQPEFLLVPSIADAREWMAERLPVVVKPLTFGGSVGVEQVSTIEELDSAIERRGEGKLLVEGAVSGPEFSWEALVRDGSVLFENVTAKETTEPPYFVELTHRCGHRFEDPKVAQQVQEFTRLVLDAIGMRTGLAHLEFRLGPDGPVLMEVAVRTPGDHIAEAVCLTYGFDLYEGVVRLALGLPLDDLIQREPVQFAAVHHPDCPPGRITGIEGLSEIEAHPFVQRVSLNRGIGDLVKPLSSSSERIGYALVVAPTPEAREETLAFIQARLRITTVLDG
ncbi:ATP-grasp domain-containing protein [Kitasatospora sp. NPDC058162]|uniref:ATP-grasp domain-containing protein n=1 Tax=Kitasatospora sp. NPDC058162 TaxID=3346362 RepID=UPI0036DC0B43